MTGATSSLGDDPLSVWLSAESAKRTGDGADQRAAFERFAATGLPHRRLEGWRWTDMRGALRQYAPVANDSADSVITPSPFSALNPIEILIVNGDVDVPAALKTPSGVAIRAVAASSTVDADDNGLIALNSAMARNALEIVVEGDAAIEQPILIRHLCTGLEPAFAQTRVRAGDGASVTIIETFEGDGAFYSHRHDMQVAPSASVRRLVWQDVGAETVLHSLCTGAIEAEGRVTQTSLATGARLSRQEAVLSYKGADIEAEINSAALLSGARHADFTTRIIHNAERCVTRQQHKAAVRDKGRAVFQGKFYVARGAQKTDADMQANALLLSETAEANHKPELEIYADDVECAHGSTAGALDEDALFYLRQRGLSAEAARGLLVKAFLNAVVDGLEENVAEVFQAQIDAWLASETADGEGA